jgi:predicted Zn-dependent protease with MMP-like domain/cytochrome c-type biogenesis protein CcmH/NrfG
MPDRDRYWDCVDQAHQASLGGRGEEALAWLDEALRLNPLGAEAYSSRGEILWDHGRYDDALRAFERAAESDPGFCAAQLNRIEILIEEFQEFEQALELADLLLRGGLDPHEEAEVYYLKAKSLFYLEDLDGALFLLKRALKMHPDVAVYRGFEGQILFELGRFEDAMGSLSMARGLEPESAHTLYHLALCLEHAGRYEQAQGYFERSGLLEPDVYPEPVRISEDDFEAAAAAAVASLPGEIRDYVADCPILVEDLPEASLVRDGDLSPQILGLFEGIPATDPDANATRLDIDRIVLFKRNLEKVAADRNELIEQIQITVKHEIGHFLGLDEEDVERLGLG